jgi:RNA polymerase sigma factor (TIGR02999 family)
MSPPPESNRPDPSPGAGAGNGAAAQAELTQRFYAELHDLARGYFARERAGHTLQPTAVVNEACLRLMTRSRLPELPREQRLALAARVLKQVLIDHARAKAADKRPAARLRVELDPELSSPSSTCADFEAIHAALERLAGLHERQAEVVSLKIFGGLGLAEIAAQVGASLRTVEGDWAVARAWLRRELAGPAQGGESERR